MIGQNLFRHPPVLWQTPRGPWWQSYSQRTVYDRTTSLRLFELNRNGNSSREREGYSLIVTHMDTSGAKFGLRLLLH